MAPIRSWLTIERATLGAAALALAGSFTVPVVTELVKDDRPTTSTACIDLTTRYQDAIERSPEMRELVLPGRDGRSTLANDPQAKDCNLGPDDYGDTSAVSN